MKNLLLLLCIALFLVQNAHSTNILVVAFFSSKSHKLTYQPLIEELGRRGHNITMVSPVKATKEAKNVKEIFTLDVETLLHSNTVNVFDPKNSGVNFGGSGPIVVLNSILETCRKTYDLPQVKSLLNEKFDLVIIQPMANDCVLGLIYRLQAPFVLFTPVSAPVSIGRKVGTHFPLSTTPSLFLGFPQNMTFAQRFINFGLEALMTVVMTVYYEPQAQAIYREKLGDDIPTVNEIFANASLVLSNGHFTMGAAKPYNPDIVDVGGIHSKPAKPIPKDLEDFIRKGEDGFILFSMGSAIRGDMMPDERRQMILNVFSKLKQQVIWKWESESMPNLPKNVKLSKWLPQQDLLGHKDIKMFITHCGGGSTEEAIYHGVPLVGIPMMGDQAQNARLAKEKGILVQINWNELTENRLENAIKEILLNSKYHENAKKLSTLFKDRSVEPLDLGVYWIEYVLRHKGASHLRSAGRNLNVLQFNSVDVISAYLGIFSIVLYLIYTVVRCFVKCICRRNKLSSSKDKQKVN